MAPAELDYDDVLRKEYAKEFRQPKGVTEDNWKSRMEFCNKMATAIDTYGAGDRLPRDFSATMESYFNNILECAVSERTQLSISASRLFTALPKILGKDLLHHIDRILPVFIKLCANTKQVIVKVAAQAVASIVQHATFSPRMLFHVCQTFEEKAAGPKQHAAIWLQTMLKEYHRFLTTPREVEMISKSLLSALEDADPSVRTSSRATYWTFSKIDRNATDEIMDKLNKSAKTALQNDPNNPDKKAGTSRPAPPRPKSSLATAKEQARKKRLEEEAQQKKGLTSSVASHDESIEVHEPVRPKVKATKEIYKTETPAATPAIDRRHNERAKTSESKIHKKTLSTDEEVIAKPSNSSRLLSAPVRRPRINVTPLNHEQDHHSKTTLPASRSEHARNEHNSQTSQTRETHRHDSRPTSSSSSKSASTVASVPVQKSNLGPSALDDKENHPAIAALGKKIRPVKPADRAEKAKEDLKSSVRGIASIHDKPIIEHASTAEPVQPLHTRPIPNYNASSPLEASFSKQVSMPRADQPGYIDLKSARSYLTYCMRDLPSALNDLIRCKKLKSSLEQHTDLISDNETWTDLFQHLCYALVDKNESRADWPQDARYSPYTRQLILQMIIPLIQNYPEWSFTRVQFWIWSVILYRCTVPINEPKDRRSELCMRNITKIIISHPSPITFIVSTLQAVEAGEETILEGCEAKKRYLQSQDHDESLLVSRHPSQHWYEPTSYYDEHDTETEDYEAQAKMAEAADLMKDYLKTASSLQTINESAPYPPTLPILYDTALQTLELALIEANKKGQRIGQQRTHDLCELARKCLESYDYMTKRSVIPYIKALYNMIEKKDEFFGYFKEEGSRNLLEYYLHGNSR